ncbi:MAG: glycosyltransferase family protein [Elusimicrobia bacterium]|nr:glycosyltransferase family protein [Elusimicrobiota bacterium]
MKLVGVLCARAASTRLPGKVLKDLCGAPMLERIIERVRAASGLDALVVATTTRPDCDPIEALARRLGCAVFRGSEEDVLGRVRQAGRAAGADAVVELNGDCPFLDPEVIDRIAGAYRSGDYDVVSNGIERTYPMGLYVKAIRQASLDQAVRDTDDPYYHEHVGLYFYAHPEKFRITNILAPRDCYDPLLRLTVDTPEDFELTRRLYEALHRPGRVFGLREVLAYLREHPQLRQLNAHVAGKVQFKIYPVENYAA